MGENDNFEYMGYVCENCEHVFLSPEEQDKEILTVSQYTLVNALQVAFIDCVNNGDEKGAESLYHIIDDIRVMAGAYRYEYCDANGRYVSPMQYQYTAEDIDNYVIINMQKYNTAVEALQKANEDIIISSGFLLCSLGAAVVSSKFAIAVSGVILAHSVVDSILSDGSAVSILGNGVSLKYSIEEDINNVDIQKSFGAGFAIMFYLNDIYQYYNNINESAVASNNYSVCIEIQSLDNISPNRTVCDFTYQFNTIDSINLTQTIDRTYNEVGDLVSSNHYNVYTSNVSGLFYDSGWSGNLID